MDNTNTNETTAKVLKPIDIVPMAYSHNETEEEGFKISKAKVGQIIWNGKNEYLFLQPVLNDDVYDALHDIATTTKKDKNCVGLYVDTSGWAAPLKEDGSLPDVPPSEHEDRFRVRLTIVITDEGIASAMGRSDTNEVLYDDGQATGGLQTSLEVAWSQVNMYTAG